MSELQHRPGVNEQSLVSRSLSLDTAQVTEEELEQILTELDQLPGIDSVDFQADKQWLQLHYDASHLNFEQIEACLNRHKIDATRGWLNRLKAGYYEFVDENIRANLKHQPHCCHTTQLPPVKRDH